MNEASLFNAFYTILKRDLTLAFRTRTEMVNPLLFFIIVISLFPLAVSPDPKVLQSMAPGVIWVAALLATLLSLDSMFRSDFDDGALEQMLLSVHPVSVLVLGKVLAHWLVTGIPLLILSPLLAVLLHMPSSSIPALMATLALGGPVLSLVGAIGVALTVGLRRGGVLLSLLILPLYIPVLIFAANAVSNAGAELSIAGQLYFLAALLALALTLAPIATASALRISLR